MNEDEYKDEMLNKYLDKQDDEEVSNCCGATLEGDLDICSDCKEHCVIQLQSERDYEDYEKAMADKADAERELRRDGY